MLNVLLQILDDGQITDAHGRKVNFENTVIVMTSNAGSDTKSAGAVGFGGSADDQGRERIMKALQDFLRPEFLNRVDEIVCFNHLTKENFAGIARIMLDELKASLGDKGYTLRYDEALVDYLVEKSYSLTYGARNLRRLIQRSWRTPWPPVSSMHSSIPLRRSAPPYVTVRCSCTHCEVSLCCFARIWIPGALTAPKEAASARTR